VIKLETNLNKFCDYEGIKINLRTWHAIKFFKGLGYRIIVGATMPRGGVYYDSNGLRRPRNGATNVYGCKDVILLSQVNNRVSGYLKRTIWAVRP
jgi:hypothetical protein